MRKTIDLTGQKIGRLTVVSKVGKIGLGRTKWLCRCDCGKEKVIFAVNLIHHRTFSCGCLHSENQKYIFTTHGHSGNGMISKEYLAWRSIKDRCYNINNPQYKDWGGRGIRVCSRWLESFQNFFDDMGLKPTPKHSIDRWPNNDGNYEPGNCRWATIPEQNRGRRSNKWIEFNGKRLVQKDWSILIGVSEHTISRFIKKGKSIGDIIQHFGNKKILN